MNKSRRMRWAGHIAHMGEKRNAYRILMAKPEGSIPLGDTDVGGRIILKLILDTMDRLCGLVVRVLGYRSGGPGSIPGTTRKKK
jgi:hypothetical protein